MILNRKGLNKKTLLTLGTGIRIQFRLIATKVSLVLFLSVFIFSCVTNKQLTYLQYQDDLKTENPTDSVMRLYGLKKTSYRLIAGDIISLRVASVTDEEFDFITKYQTDLGIIRKLGQYRQNIDSDRGGNNNTNRLNVSAQGNISSLVVSGQNIGFTLDKDGKLELPEIGEVQLAGFTISEAELKVQQLLNGYYEIPVVRIELLNYHFTVLGEVENEGRFTSFDPEITVFDAISLAGNIGEFADRSNVKIIRQNGEMAKVIYLNMLDETMLNADNFYIQRDDIIVVPALKARTTQTYTLPNFAKTLGMIGAITGILALVISLSR